MASFLEKANGCVFAFFVGVGVICILIQDEGSSMGSTLSGRLAIELVRQSGREEVSVNVTDLPSDADNMA